MKALVSMLRSWTDRAMGAQELPFETSFIELCQRLRTEVIKDPEFDLPTSLSAVRDRSTGKVRAAIQDLIYGVSSAYATVDWRFASIAGECIGFSYDRRRLDARFIVVRDNPREQIGRGLMSYYPVPFTETLIVWDEIPNMLGLDIRQPELEQHLCQFWKETRERLPRDSP